MLKENMKKTPNVVVGEKLTDSNGRYIHNLASIMNVSDENNVNEVISVIFSKLGLDYNDTIVIEDTLKNAWDMVELKFKINDEKTWYIKFHRRFGKDVLGVAIVDGNKDYYSYRCKTLETISDDMCESKIDVLMKLQQYTLGLASGNAKDFINCTKDYHGVVYSFGSPVSKNGKNAQDIYFKITCSEDVANENIARGEYYVPKNEKALISYLSKCSYPVKIDKLYHDIISLCFDGDKPECPLFDLHVLMSKQYNGEVDRIITDSIIIKDGVLKTFGMMKNGSVEGCSVKNVGATVEFIGNSWMNYHAFIPKNSYASLRVQKIDEKDSLIDFNLVKDTACRMIEMFPEDASRMLGEKFYSDCIESSLESDGLFSIVDKPKQYRK